MELNSTLCVKSGSLHDLLKSHKLTPMSALAFICSEWEKYFVSYSKLKAHRRTHTGEILACSLCNKSFSRSSDLRVHIMTHTEEKPFGCTQCDELCSRTSTLNIFPVLGVTIHIKIPVTKINTRESIQERSPLDALTVKRHFLF